MDYINCWENHSPSTLIVIKIELRISETEIENEACDVYRSPVLGQKK